MKKEKKDSRGSKKYSKQNNPMYGQCKYLQKKTKARKLKLLKTNSKKKFLNVKKRFEVAY